MKEWYTGREAVRFVFGDQYADDPNVLKWKQPHLYDVHRRTGLHRVKDPKHARKWHVSNLEAMREEAHPKPGRPKLGK